MSCGRRASCGHPRARSTAPSQHEQTWSRPCSLAKVATRRLAMSARPGKRCRTTRLSSSTVGSSIDTTAKWLLSSAAAELARPAGGEQKKMRWSKAAAQQRKKRVATPTTPTVWLRRGRALSYNAPPLERCVAKSWNPPCAWCVSPRPGTKSLLLSTNGKIVETTSIGARSMSSISSQLWGWTCA